MTKNDLEENFSEEGSSATPTPPAAPQRTLLGTLKKFSPWGAGLLAFLIGIIFFAPLESYAYLALRQLQGDGTRIEVNDLSLSTLGRFKVQGIKIPLTATNSNEGVLKIAEAKGKISLWNALLGDKYDSHTEAVIFSFHKGDFTLKIDSLEIDSDVSLAKSGGTNKTISGTFGFTAESAQLVYKEKKFLKEEIVIPFLKVNLKCRAQQNNIAIETGDAVGRLVNAQIRGSIQMGPTANLNIDITLRPTNEFFEKYQDKDPRTLLKFAGILQDDDRIELNIRGSMAAPVVTPVKVQGASPFAPSAPATP